MYLGTILLIRGGGRLGRLRRSFFHFTDIKLGEEANPGVLLLKHYLQAKLWNL